MTTMEQHRAILGVGRDATTAEIRDAYRRAAKLAHPDLGGSSETFQRVRTAADALLAELKSGHSPDPDRSRSHGGGDRTGLPGHWLTASAELRRVWGLSGAPVTVFAPQKIGLSPFVAEAKLDAPAYNWLILTIGPRRQFWDFHVTDTVTRIFFRRADDARQFKLRFR